MSKLLCSVVTEPVYGNNICTFKVDVQGRTFTVVSKNRQAVKDNIFVTGNQKLEIEGKVVDDTIFTRKSIIKLK
jgi:hypothetical protein